ncbi:Interleukin-8 like protein [Scophthalmus maximus]|uniref:Interleukin-8 like protein n=1 Tax=Scophthalmus maximus TaxID=52904 RepID=A0A2U9C6H8_SCOMX|nr:platelet basic protein [Scophthalmus maximus]AWP12165.1 Interleukin-8 like protein [Scophthalmus maximus]
MSGIIKVCLLLAVMVCVSTAQHNESGQNCLCRNVRNDITKSNVKDIQIYPATIFCDRVEIVVTASSGLRYCLNPRVKKVRALLAKIMRSQKTTTTRPDSSSTAHI